MTIDVKSPIVAKEPYEQKEMGVLIGLVGDLKGRIIIDGTPEIFGAIGSAAMSSLRSAIVSPFMPIVAAFHGAPDANCG